MYNLDWTWIIDNMRVKFIAYMKLSTCAIISETESDFNTGITIAIEIYTMNYLYVDKRYNMKFT